MILSSFLQAMTFGEHRLCPFCATIFSSKDNRFMFNTIWNEMKSAQPLILEECFEKDPSLNLFPFLVIHPRSENPWIRIFLWLLPPSLTDYNLLWPRLLCPRKVSLRYKSGSLPQQSKSYPALSWNAFLFGQTLIFKHHLPCTTELHARMLSL